MAQPKLVQQCVMNLESGYFPDRNQVCNHLQSVCYQFAIKWGQVGNYMYSVLIIRGIKCDKSVEICCLNTFTDISF